MNELDRAAARRADALNHRNDRPAQRRNAEHPQSRSGVLSPASLTLREADEGPAERVGERIDRAAEGVRDAVDPPSGPLERAGRAIDRATD